MPHHAAIDEDDPIIASYPVYLTTPNLPSGNSSQTPHSSTAQKLLLLQYPAHRLAETPYNARNLQKPTSLRIKPSTGLLELDIPIDTKLNYNPDKGTTYANSLKRSRVIQEGGTHGLSGGFNTGAAARNLREDEEIDMNTIPAHSSLSDEPTFNLQTLGGKIVKPSPGDPIYLLGSFQNNSLHLSHLDALVQVRPQLHHLDAVDELERNRGTAALVRARGKDGTINGDMPAPLAGQSARPESKAIDIKLKSSGPSSHNNDLSTNTNAHLLRAIQQEPWQTFDWIDEDDVEAHQHAERALHLSLPPENDLDTLMPPNLQSAISNSQWLDLISAPRIDHGKKGSDKGLMGKVRGRDRERQRRRKNEVAKKERATTTAAQQTPLAEGGGESNRVATGPVQAGNTIATTAEETADDDDDSGASKAGPSDEDSSEDEHAPTQQQREAAEEIEDEDEARDDVEMLDQPSPIDVDIPQMDGPAGDSDDVQEVVMPTPAKEDLATTRRRMRPRKTQGAVEPIVVDD